jgi:hypothetical protein
MKAKKLTPVNNLEVKPKRKYTKRKDREIKEVSSTHSLQYIKGLEDRVQSLTNQNTALKIDLLDQTAVINYLEKKLGV